MKKYHLFYQKLPWYDPEQVFLTLYTKRKYTFWLDNKDYSYMGSASKRIKYTLSNHTLSISNNNKTQNSRQSIFAYLQKELLSWKGLAGVGDPRRAPAVNEVTEDVGRGKRPTGPRLDFTGGFVGYFGYEMWNDIQNFASRREALASASQRRAQSCALPDAYFFFVNKFLAFDHRQKCLYLVALSQDKNEAGRWLSTTAAQLSSLTSNPLFFNSQLSTLNSTPTFTLSRNHQQYLKDIRTCQKYLVAGDAYQICLTNQITLNIKTNWLALFRTLRRINPAPFSTYINFGNFSLLSSSPEQFLHVDKKGWVTAKPMKGTLRRGDNPEEDTLLAKHLGKAKKYYAENIMIVDLIRNDLGKVCKIGSIKVTKPLTVETYATVHQLVSTIKGKLLPGLTVVDLLQATFPSGSMTGTPKIAAMEIINELEKSPRGIYSGTFGFLSLNGTANLAMTIRTIIATKDHLSIGTGGAILTDSIPQEEYNEILLKAQALIEAIVKTTKAKSYKIIGNNKL